MGFMNNNDFQVSDRKRSADRLRGQTPRAALSAITGVAVAAMTLSGCSSLYEGEVGFVEGFFGGVAADEPRAALVGRDVLSAGGSAVDAAVAMYFTLSVTLPSAAGLGGGGVCLVHDSKTKATRTLEFLPGTPQHPGGDRPAAVPGNPRGFFAMHSLYGKLQWGTLVSPAENLARFGQNISRAFAADLAGIGPAILADEGMRVLYADKSGELLAEGARLRQENLASTLGSVRAQGPGDFYTGHTAARIVEAYERAGAHLTVADLRGYLPRWTETVRGTSGNETVHFPATTLGGMALSSAWRALEDGEFDGADAAGKARALAAAARRGFTDSGAAGRLGNPSATGFVAADRKGSAVACAVTMNAPFGTGRIAPGTGMVPAALAGPGGRGPDALAVMLVINHNVNEFHYAAAGSGGVAAPTALLNVAGRALLDDALLGDALAAARVHHGGVPDRAYYEQGLGADAIAALGAGAQHVPGLGRVVAIACPKGIPPNPENCAALADPRGAGLGSMSEDK